MHRKTSKNHKRNVFLLIAASALSVIVAAVLVVMFAGKSNGSASGSIRMQTVMQPATAQQIARNLHCTGFKDTGPAKWLSTDSGSCYIGSQKYALNTFPDKQARDDWLKLAAPYGVKPKWETDTSVVYPSVG